MDHCLKAVCFRENGYFRYLQDKRTELHYLFSIRSDTSVHYSSFFLVHISTFYVSWMYLIVMSFSYFIQVYCELDTISWSVNLKARDHSEGLHVDERIILEWILRKIG